MKRMKKWVLIVIILFVICLIADAGLLLYNHLNKVKLNKLIDNVYHYSIEKKKDEYLPFTIKGDNIYYILSENGVFNLYKRNIKRKNDVLIGTIDGNQQFCSFDPNYIFCFNDNYDYYDYDLNKIYTYVFDDTNEASLIFYQGEFLTLKDKKLYKGDDLFRELKFDLDDVFLNGDYSFIDNTYLTFYSREADTYYHYDVKNDTYKKYNEALWNKYNKGYYAVRNNEIAVYDFITNEISKYSELYLSDGVFDYTLYDNLFYFVENNKLYVMNLDEETIDVIEYGADNDITQVIKSGDFIYLFSVYDKCDVFVIDLKNIKKTTYTYDEYKEYMKKTVDDKVSELENKYGVNIVYRDEVNIDNETFKTVVLDNDYTISKALEHTEKVLSKFNKEFFDSFRDDTHQGLIINLSGNLVPKEGVNTAASPTGYTIYDNDEYEMVVDARLSDLESTICHELMHNAENKMGYNLYEGWVDLNPYYYEYQYSYTDSSDSQFTMYEENPNLVYFVDTYAKSYPTEDYARVFENICNKDSNSILNKYPHLYDKALYLKEKLIDAFPSLKEATVFNSLNK